MSGIGLDPGSGGSSRGAASRSNGDPAAGQARVFLLFPKPNTPPPSGGGWPATSGERQTVWECYVNPEQLEISYPTRGQIIQTLGGAYVDSFGYGLPSGQLSGTFGWGKDAYGKTGLSRLADLKALYENWQESTVVLPTDSQLLVTYGRSGGVANYNVFLTVYWQKLVISRSRASPLLANYTLSFTVVRDHNAKNQKPVIPPIASATTGATPGITSGSGSSNGSSGSLAEDVGRILAEIARAAADAIAQAAKNNNAGGGGGRQ